MRKLKNKSFIHTSRSQIRWYALDTVEKHALAVVMVTVVVHLFVKLEPMAGGYYMALSVGEVDAVTQLKDILSLQELPSSDHGSINKWPRTKTNLETNLVLVNLKLICIEISQSF